MKNVKQIVHDYLTANGYQGLCTDYCECGLDDLMPCDDYCVPCTAAYKTKCPNCHAEVFYSPGTQRLDCPECGYGLIHE